MKSSGVRSKARDAAASRLARAWRRLVVMTMCLTGALGAQPVGTLPADRSGAAVAGADAGWSGYGIVPGDVLVVTIWREPELGGTLLVHEDGVATFPMLGRLAVEGMTVAALRDSLMQRYARDLREPIITLEHRRRVFVLGDVNQPGLQTLDPTVSLAGAVSLAGGANALGNLRRIRVLRDGKVLITKLDPKSPLGDLPLRSGDQIHVGRRGWFERNSTFLTSLVLSTATVFAALAPR
jgi:polysaccharide export outer membrane protein